MNNLNWYECEICEKQFNLPDHENVETIDDQIACAKCFIESESD